MSKTMGVSLRALLLAAVLPTASLCRMQGQQIAEDDPTIRVNVELVQLDAGFSSTERYCVVHEIEINPLDPYTRTGGYHANHAHAADRSDHRGITRYWPRNRAEAR